MTPITDHSQLPGWVHYLAQDEDGQWWGYEAEPNQSHNGWYENEVGRCLKLQKAEPNADWLNALISIKRN